ncbi:MAG: hypothetical protein JWM04_2236 [Verrucomicrobiales bacterium]|nr:hypothetical protein [Verrucomicrobiales bacterium]
MRAFTQGESQAFYCVGRIRGELMTRRNPGPKHGAERGAIGPGKIKFHG